MCWWYHLLDENVDEYRDDNTYTLTVKNGVRNEGDVYYVDKCGGNNGSLLLLTNDFIFKFKFFDN